MTAVNDDPVITSISSTTPSANYGDVFTLLAPITTISATDIDSTTLTATTSWKLNGGSTFTSGLPDSGTMPGGLVLENTATGTGSGTWVLRGVADLAPGTYIIRVTINDGDGGSAFQDITLTVSARAALVNYIGQTEWVTSGTSSTTAQVTLTASMQDPTGTALAGAKVDFIDCATGKVLAGGVKVSQVAGSPDNTGTANAIVTLSTGQYGAESYVILVKLTGNYDNTAQAISDKTATLVVSKPATTNEICGGGTIANLTSDAGTYSVDGLGAGEEAVTYSIGMKYNKGGTNPQGKITLSIQQSDGVIWVKSNSITSMSVTGTNDKNATIYTKATIYKVLNDGSTVTIDGNVTLRMDIVEYQSGTLTDRVGFTVLSSKTSELYYSNNWVLVGNVWKTQMQDTDENDIKIG